MSDSQSKNWIENYRGIYAEIKLANLLHNFDVAKTLNPAAKFFPVIKANAYGHGAIPLAQHLLQHRVADIAGFGLASVEEAISLRAAGIKDIPLISFGGPFDAPAEVLLQHQITPVIYDEQHVHALGAQAKKLNQILPIYLKVDTGMTRLGVLPDELIKLLNLLQQTSSLQLKGVMTHLACADVYDDGVTALQYERFSDAVKLIKQKFTNVDFIHIANSAAILAGNLGNGHFARPGIMLYGSYPHERFKSKSKSKLLPVMQFKTKLISVKTVAAGVAVSYCGTYVTKRESRIAVMAVGYADGYSRAFSNSGQVILHGNSVPIVGRVCMDHTMIDVSDIPQAKIGDEVLLFGEELPAENLAAKINTIAYEMFCAVASRVPRVYR